jgi:adenylate kinase family enzyme
LERPDIIKRKNENEFVVSKLILELRKIQRYKILIEDFPQNKEQYTYFVNNCKPFKQIFFLKAENSSCFERVNKIKLDDENYTECSKLDKMLMEFDNKKPFIDFLKKNTDVIEIDVNNHINLTIERMLKKIQPYCVYFENEVDEESKNELFNKLKTNYKFSEISLKEIITNAIKRKILVNKENEPIENINLTLEQKINLIRPLLYREDCKNIMLNSFPSNIEELNEFESKLFSINKFVQLTTKKKLGTINDVNSMAVHFFNKNKLITLNPKNSSDYKIEEILDMTRDINIIYGMPQSGKTTFAKHLKEKYSFELLDFKEVIEKVKKTKIDPENPDAEPEINFQDLINYLKNFLKNDTFFKNKKILLENFFIQNSPEPYLIDTYEKAIEIIKLFGKFRNFYEIETEEKTLIDKYKQKEGITEELSEDQKASFLETLEKPKKLVEDIRQISENIIKIKCDEPELKSKQLFDSKYGINFIIIKHEYDIIIEKTLQLFCARNKILYINVPYLIYNHFYENDEFSQKLEGVYGKRQLGVECKNPYNFDEMLYYKYNPIFFEKDLINKIILNHIGQNYKIIENAGNFVILTGYLNSDLLHEQESPYNLPLFEIKNALELGELTSFIQISRKDIKKTEDEIPEEIVIEKPKKEIKEEGEEGDGNPEGEEEPQEEENPDGVPKFKPENYKWTSYDGQPRNYVQVLKRLKMFPVNAIKTDKCREELIKAIKLHLDNFVKKDENKYEGIINIINVEDNINEETIELVNELGKIDVIVEEQEEVVEKEEEKNQNEKEIKKSGKK